MILRVFPTSNAPRHSACIADGGEPYDTQLKTRTSAVEMHVVSLVPR